MSGAIYLVVQCAVWFVDILLVAMMVRAIMSWFFMPGQNVFVNLLYFITEPVILPVRQLCARFGWFMGVPMDMPYFITTILLMILNVVLENSFLA